MSGLKILIVDDDQGIRDLYDKGLEGSLFEKQFADNGHQALEIYEAWKPDVIVLDIVMPVMTGYAVLQEIRKDRMDASTKIIMATSLSDKQNVLDCVKLGIQGFIVKPFKPNEISSRILQYAGKAAPPQSGADGG